LLSESLTASRILEEVKSIEDEIIRIRRQIHANPELSYKEIETARLVAEYLRKLNIEVRDKVGGNGVVGLLKGSKPGKVVALRADMDALPVSEDADVPFKSKNKGVMHACGHDAHVAMLLGAAKILAKHKDELSGSVKFLFQPAEENLGRGGAKPMIEDGAMLNPKVDFVFGLHIGNLYPSGTFALKAGSLMAAPDAFKITIKGKGGHGSAPEGTIDPIFVSYQVFSAIQGISSRMIKQTEPFVLSVCSVHSGTRNNVIPDFAEMEGTIRTLNENTRTKAKRLVKRITESTCRTFNASCVVEFIEDAYPVTINDPLTTRRAMKVLKKMEGTKTVEAEVVLAGEDFSRFLQVAPGSYYFLGSINPEKGCIHPNHSSKFKVDEEVLKFGSASLAMLALEFTEGK
jgi:carboxypeptidase Ss1